jgi:peptidoglycan/xylan/chitin deacetylase (PgdA/CDA1 family)
LSELVHLLHHPAVRCHSTTGDDMRTDNAYPRDMIGYGRNPPHPQWPGDARIALQLALNYECGAETNILHGDASSEGALNDIGAPAVPGKRIAPVEGVFEFGSRCGAWRFLRIMDERRLRFSFLASGMAIERNPEIARAAAQNGHEMVGHGYRWIDHHSVSMDQERKFIAQAVDSINRITGQRPIGWLSGRAGGANTRQLLVEEGGFVYDRDCLNDELPYWVKVGGKAHLCIPYSFETNDLRFGVGGDWVQADDFYIYMRDAFDVLYAEGERQPKMMTVALHDRIIGRPARAAGLLRFLDHVQKHDRVWIATGAEIANHWMKNFPAPAELSE